MPEVGKAPPKPSRVDRPDDGDAEFKSAPVAAPAAKKEKAIVTLPPELQSKPEIMGYLNQYGFGAKECENLYRTPIERASLDAYTKSKPIGRVPDEFFIAAIRLWNSGRYPVKKTEGESLDSMAIGAE